MGIPLTPETPFATLFHRALVHRDREAYAAAVEPFHDRIFAWAYRLVWGDADLAEAVRSRVFGKLLESAVRLSFDAPTPLGVWLYRTTLHLARQELATRPPGAGLTTVAEPVDPHDGLDELQRLDDDRRAVRRTAGGLSVEDQEVLALRAADEPFSREEMADILGLSVIALRTRLSRALDRLHDALPADLGDRYPRGGGRR